MTPPPPPLDHSGTRNNNNNNNAADIKRPSVSLWQLPLLHRIPPVLLSSRTKPATSNATANADIDIDTDTVDSGSRKMPAIVRRCSGAADVIRFPQTCNSNSGAAAAVISMQTLEHSLRSAMDGQHTAAIRVLCHCVGRHVTGWRISPRYGGGGGGDREDSGGSGGAPPSSSSSLGPSVAVSTTTTTTTTDSSSSSSSNGGSNGSSGGGGGQVRHTHHPLTPPPPLPSPSPPLVLLFAGPPGSGMLYLARRLAMALHRPYVYLDSSSSNVIVDDNGGGGNGGSGGINDSGSSNIGSSGNRGGGGGGGSSSSLRRRPRRHHHSNGRDMNRSSPLHSADLSRGMLTDIVSQEPSAVVAIHIRNSGSSGGSSDDDGSGGSSTMIDRLAQLLLLVDGGGGGAERGGGGGLDLSNVIFVLVAEMAGERGEAAVTSLLCQAVDAGEATRHMLAEQQQQYQRRRTPSTKDDSSRIIADNSSRGDSSGRNRSVGMRRSHNMDSNNDSSSSSSSGTFNGASINSASSSSIDENRRPRIGETLAKAMRREVVADTIADSNLDDSANCPAETLVVRRRQGQCSLGLVEELERYSAVDHLDIMSAFTSRMHPVLARHLFGGLPDHHAIFRLIDAVVPFFPVSRQELLREVVARLQTIARMAKNNKGLRLTFGEDAVLWLMKRQRASVSVNALVDAQVLTMLASIDSELQSGDVVHLTVESDEGLTAKVRNAAGKNLSLRSKL